MEQDPRKPEPPKESSQPGTELPPSDERNDIVRAFSDNVEADPGSGPFLDRRDRSIQQHVADLTSELSGLRTDLAILEADEAMKPDPVRTERIEQLRQQLVLVSHELAITKAAADDYRNR